MLDTGTYWLTRVVFLRYLCFIYFIAFLVAYHQNRSLIGENGLLPFNNYMSQLNSQLGSDRTPIEKFWEVPTILWWFEWTDSTLDALAMMGIGLSLFVVICGWATKPIMLSLWVLYTSIVSVGQRWYSFGWESQLLEIGFAAIFLVPFVTPGRFPVSMPAPLSVVWANRWLVFRLMIGAGMIKIRGDQCWRDLTCMHYHYQTQPNPNPVSPFLHHSPSLFHNFETMVNHVVELPMPFLLFGTRRVRAVGGAIQILFQCMLIASGNLSFLNWLTIAPCIFAFDDAVLAPLFSASTLCRVRQLQNAYLPTELGAAEKCGEKKESVETAKRPALFLPRYLLHTVVSFIFTVSIGYLSIPVAQNLVSTRQHMNASFDRFRIVNTYGAFGSVTKTRDEVVFEGTYAPNPNDPNAEWYEYDFKCKPTDVDRAPCLISPYHYRLDWLMWFCGFQSYQQNPWLIQLAARLVAGDPIAYDLMGEQRFWTPDTEPPRWVRAQHFRYEYTDPYSNETSWWTRELLGEYFPPISPAHESVQQFLQQQRWHVPLAPTEEDRSRRWTLVASSDGPKPR